MNPGNRDHGLERPSPVGEELLDRKDHASSSWSDAGEEMWIVERPDDQIEQFDLVPGDI